MSGTEQLRRDEGCPIYFHNVGGKEPDGKPTRLGKWTFGTKMVRDVVLDHVSGRVLNACAGKTRLQKRGCEFVRNDIDEDRDADLHVDVREIHQHLETETFDSVILDPPFDPGRAAKLYEGWHGQEYANARDAVAELVCPGGTVVELGWNSWSLSDKDGWEPVEHHLFRQSSFKGDVHLTVDRKVNQKRLVSDGDDWNSRYAQAGTNREPRTDGGHVRTSDAALAAHDHASPLKAALDYLLEAGRRAEDHAVDDATVARLQLAICGARLAFYATSEAERAVGLTDATEHMETVTEGADEEAVAEPVRRARQLIVAYQGGDGA